MNFVFILDTSISMLQTFDTISYFDSAKSGIEYFLKRRENVKTKIKPDKYFLMTCSDDVNQSILSNWAMPTDHFLFQLKSVKINHDFTNEDFAIQNAFNMLNYMRKIGPEKHVHGRLISKIQNSFIIVFTDGGKLSSLKKVMRKDSKISLMSSSFNEDSKDLYSEAFRWDQSIFVFILGENPDEEGMQILRKFTLVVGGSVVLSKDMEALMRNIEDFAEQKFLVSRVNVNLEINNIAINVCQQNDLKMIDYDPSDCNPFQKISFIAKSSFNKILVTLKVEMRPVRGTPNINLNEGDISSPREKWPLPDEVLMNIKMKSLPRKRAIPSYIIANEIRHDFSIHRADYDEYEIADKDFLVKFLSNYPALTLEIAEKCLIPATEKKSKMKPNKKILWDVYVEIPSSSIEKKPFAVLKLIFDNKSLVLVKETDEMKKMPLSEYAKSDESSIKLKFCVLPYGFREFFSIVSKYESNLISKPEFTFQIDKYMTKIPFYYKPYIVSYLEKKNLWKVDDNFYKTLDEENLNESVLHDIKALSKQENEEINENTRTYNKNKQLHLSKHSPCCRVENLKRQNLANNISRSSLNKVNNIENMEKFLKRCCNINSFIKCGENAEDLLYMNTKARNDPCEAEIESMGDYRERVLRQTPLRSPRAFDNEIKEFKGDWFGNPFSTIKFDDDANNLNLDRPNIGIKDGESILINSDTKNEIHINLNSMIRKDDDELSVYPTMNHKRLRNGISVNDLNENLNPKRSNSQETKQKGSLQSVLIDDDLLLEFKELFSKNLERNGLKITNKLELNMNDIYDWKLKEKMKDFCKRLFEHIRTNKNIISLLEEILSKPYLFYSEQQKKKFLSKVVTICENFGCNRLMLNRINKIIHSISDSDK